MRNLVFTNGEFYHIYNRGTDKRRVFLQNKDYERFILGMKLFNSLEPINHFNRLLAEVSPRPNRPEALVKIVAYCLMPNHFHLILEQVQENGISKYIQKLLTGYTMYFNKRYERSGVLFQGVFKSKHIKDNSYLLHLTRYIHLNPVEAITPNCHDMQLLNRLLNKFKWSSYFDYIGIRQGESIVDNSEIVLNQFKNKKKYRDFVLGLIGKKRIDSDWPRFRLDKNE